MDKTWIRVKENGSGTIDDPHRPKYSGRVDGWSGHRIGNSPNFVCLFYADSETLSDIESKSDVKNLTEEKALDLLNSASDPRLNNSGRPWDKEEMKRRFCAG